MGHLDDLPGGDAVDAAFRDAVLGHDPGCVFTTHSMRASLNCEHGLDVGEEWVEGACRQLADEDLLISAGGGVYCLPAFRSDRYEPFS